MRDRKGDKGVRNGEGNSHVCICICADCKKYHKIKLARTVFAK